MKESKDFNEEDDEIDFDNFLLFFNMMASYLLKLEKLDIYRVPVDFQISN